MSSVEGLPVIQYFADISGKSLDDGFVYIGTSGLDPVANPISVFWDAALTIPAPNPIRTRNGHPDRSGVPARFFVDTDSYSFAVKNKNGTTVYTALDSISATDIERRLRNSNDIGQGGGIVGWKRTPFGDVIDADAIGGAISLRAVNIWEYANLVTDKPTPSDPETWDWSPALQGAINQIVAYAESINRSYGLPAIEIPGGKFKLNTSISTKPWVMIRSNGPVVFDFTGAATSSHGFVCDNFTTITQDALKFSGNHAPFLNGKGGSISILGHGETTNTGQGLRIGNFAAAGKQCRDVRIANLVVTGFGTAQAFGNNDTYLFHADNCRFEDCATLIQAPTSNVNSGERMEWVNCTFAGSEVVVNHNCTGFDVNLIDCSLDFNANIVKFGAASNFCQVRLNHCYFEAFDGYIIDGTLLTGTSSGNQVAAAVDSPIILPRDKTGANPVNSPSRTLFTGPFSLSLTNPKVRYEKRHYIEDGNLVAPDVSLVASSGYHINPVPGPVTLANIVNNDFDFQKDAAGTSADSLTQWDRIAGSIGGTITTRDLFEVGGTKKVLRIVAATGTDTTTISFRSKFKIPCRAGDEFYQSLTLNANLATGNISVNAWMEFFDDADVSLGLFPSFTQYIFRDALNDATLPNFGSGNDRWMDTQGFRSIAPKNTAYGKMRFALNQFDGTLYVSRARAWKVGAN